MNALHNTYREVVLFLLYKQTSTIIFLQLHSSQREEKSYHSATDELSLRNTIILLHSFVVYVNEYHLQKVCLVMATFCCGSDLMADSCAFCAGDKANPLWQINAILV